MSLVLGGSELLRVAVRKVLRDGLDERGEGHVGVDLFHAPRTPLTRGRDAAEGPSAVGAVPSGVQPVNVGLTASACAAGAGLTGSGNSLVTVTVAN
jgi:hypothetical protein